MALTVADFGMSKKERRPFVATYTSHQDGEGHSSEQEVNDMPLPRRDQ